MDKDCFVVVARQSLRNFTVKIFNGRYATLRTTAKGMRKLHE